ncbi:MAG: hypothetical protein V1682_00025 [Candidatus Omnitrophota bacterium]
MPEDKKCSICGKIFTPGMRCPGQSVCLSPECQRERQLNNMRRWRAKKASSPDSESWKEVCRCSSLEWRRKHHAYLKLYRDEHKKERSEYMKEYMKRYRKRGKSADKEGDKPR